jgi:hypothetical protein
MNIYFTASQIPELRDLPQAVRRVVIRRALDILRSRARLFYWLPILLCVTGCIGGMYLPPLFFHLPAKPNNNILLNGMLGLLAGFSMAFVAGFIGSQLQLWKLRPLLRGVINNYIAEIYD